MLCLIAGKLMSLLIQFLLIKLFKNACPNNLSTIERTMGWFLIEHIFEQYNLTSGKFFMMNEDFRRLITNFVKTIRNLVFWSHIITVLELFTFILIIGFLVYLTSIHIYFKSTKKYTFKDCFYFLFSFWLILKIYYRYSKFDIFFISRPLGILFDFICVLFYVFLIFFILHNYLVCSKFITFKDLQIKYLLIKFSIYLILLIIVGYSVYLVILNENVVSNNFIQELTLQVLFTYAYIYYILR